MEWNDPTSRSALCTSARKKWIQARKNELYTFLFPTHEYKCLTSDKEMFVGTALVEYFRLRILLSSCLISEAEIGCMRYVLRRNEGCNASTV